MPTTYTFWPNQVVALTAKATVTAPPGEVDGEGAGEGDGDGDGVPPSRAPTWRAAANIGGTEIAAWPVLLTVSVRPEHVPPAKSPAITSQ